MRLDRANLVFVSAFVSFLGCWAVFTQSAVVLKAPFQLMTLLFFVSLAGGFLAALAARRQPILCFKNPIPPENERRAAHLISLVVCSAALCGSYVLAYVSELSVLFFLCTVGVLVFGVWSTYREKRTVLKTGNCSPISLAECSAALLLGAVFVALPLMFNRYNPDDAFYLNVASRMSADMRPPLHFDTMIGDPEQVILLPTYVLETHLILNAVIASLTGLSTIEVAHLLLPPLSALLILSIYAMFFRLTAGSYWLAALVAALAILFMFGDHSRSFGNYSVLRLQHAKTLLYTGLMPLVFILTVRFWYHPNLFGFACLALSQSAGVGLSANGVYLGPLAAFVSATGLLIFDPLKWRTYVLCGLSCIWPISMGLWVLVSTGAYPSEFVEPASVLRDLASVYGGSPRALFMIAALAGWSVLSGLSRQFYVGTVAVFSILVLNPWLAPFFSERVTGNLNYRLFFVLPVALFAGIATSSVANYLALSERTTTIIAFSALLIVAVSPASIFNTENRVRFDPFGYNVPSEIYRDAEGLLPYLQPDGIALAPEELAIWLATFGNGPSLVAVRNVYLVHYKHTRSNDDVRARMAALAVVTSNRTSTTSEPQLTDAIEMFEVTDLVLSTTHPNLTELIFEAQKAGFRKSREVGNYILLKPEGM